MCIRDSIWREEATDFNKIIDELKFLKSLPKTGFDSTFSFYENITPNSLSKLGGHLSEKMEGAKTRLHAFFSRINLNETERFNGGAVEQRLQALHDSLTRISDNNSDYDGWVRFARARNHLVEKGASRFVVSVKSGSQSSEAALNEIALSLIHI